MTKRLYVCISLDVEEEGLFSGAYACREVSVSNVPLLKQLAPLADLGFPLTLFCAWPVFRDENATKTILWMRDHCGAEIGAHLHHWSTPPYTNEEPGAPIRIHKLAPELFGARLRNLLQAAADVCGQPVNSFRMGRWDLKRTILPLLAEAGIKVDSSICPLRAFRDGPDHFLAPASPYRVQTVAGPILEVPVTQIPLFPPLAKFWYRIARNFPRILDSFHFCGALSANPVWHRQSVMQAATWLHSARGGHILNLFLHSSELMPGGSPHIPDQHAADALIRKITSFCKWLKTEFAVTGITLKQLLREPFKDEFPIFPQHRNTDW